MIRLDLCRKCKVYGKFVLTVKALTFMYLTLLFKFVCLLPFYKLCVPLHSTVGVVKPNFKLSCFNCCERLPQNEKKSKLFA